MLIVEADGPVLRVTLNRPEVRNAFNDELIAELTDTFTNLSSDIRAVVLSGNGPAFCAGGDLQWMRKAAGYTEEENYQDALKLAGLFTSMCSARAVIIAAVHGPAFGGGCGLVAASDVALATGDALFAFSEVRLGLIPATISPFVIGKIGPGHARALFTTGEAFDATHALRIGLVHEVTTADVLQDAIDRKLASVLAAGPNAVASSKQLALTQNLTPEACARLLATARAGDEAKEGVAAFLEKRSPSFKVKR